MRMHLRNQSAQVGPNFRQRADVGPISKFGAEDGPRIQAKDWFSYRGTCFVQLYLCLFAVEEFFVFSYNDIGLHIKSNLYLAIMYVLVGDAESDLHLLHLQQIKPSAHLSFHGRLQLASVLTHVRGKSKVY